VTKLKKKQPNKTLIAIIKTTITIKTTSKYAEKKKV